MSDLYYAEPYGKTEPREQECAHHWVADGYFIRCAACQTSLGVGVTDTGIRFGHDGRQTNDLAERACWMAQALAQSLNALALSAGQDGEQ